MVLEVQVGGIRDGIRQAFSAKLTVKGPQILGKNSHSKVILI
jgi:hypothetical protein